MGTEDETKPIGRIQPGAPTLPPGRAGARGQFGLRQIMLLTVYFAIVFWLGRSFNETDSAFRQVLAVVAIGMGLSALGLWAATRMTRSAFVGWIVFVIGYMIVLGATVGILAIPSLPVLIGSIIYLQHRRRATEREALLWVMALSAERKMPLGPGILAFSEQASGVTRRRAEGIAGILGRGGSLPDALDSVPRAVPPEAPILIRMGQESGDLAAGLREAVASRSGQAPILRGFGARVAYLCWVLFVGESVVSFTLYFIIPRLEAIFQDFGIGMPRATMMVVRISHVVVQYGALGMLAQAAVLFYLLFVFVGWANMNVPLIDRLFRRRHLAVIFRALAVIVSAGRPIGPALRSLGEWYPTRWVSRKLSAAASYEDQGIGWVDAMGATGLISPGEAGVLEAARRVGNLPWALRELAETGERRLGYRLQAWSQVLFLLVMLLLGALTLVIAVAYFTPLTTLIERLAE